jgi:hypothetical protein
MTPPATAVASDVQSLARRAPRKRIARRSAPAGLTQSASASRTRSTHPEVLRLATEKRLECDIDLDFRLPHERTIAMGWQVRL